VPWCGAIPVRCEPQYLLLDGACHRLGLWKELPIQGNTYPVIHGKGRIADFRN
jgi:hypothetical protein